MDWYNLIASERGMPDGWKWFELRAAGADAIVKGAVCTTLFKSGKYKGTANWSKRDRATEREIVITKEQLDARKLRYEAETGLCWKCIGTKEEFAGAGPEGVRMRPCLRCKATGQAPKEMP